MMLTLSGSLVTGYMWEGTSPQARKRGETASGQERTQKAVLLPSPPAADSPIVSEA